MEKITIESRGDGIALIYSKQPRTLRQHMIWFTDKQICNAQNKMNDHIHIFTYTHPNRETQ